MPTVKDVIVKKPSAEESENCKGWPIWTCDVSTFDWDYTQTEHCLILEGKVTVKGRLTGEDEEVTFGPGDFVTFPVGLKCTWQVSEAVKKHYNFE